MKSSKKIMIPISYGLVARNILRTGLLDLLLKNGYTIQLVTTASDSIEFRAEFCSPKIAHIKYPKIKQAKFFSLLQVIFNLLTFGPSATETLKIKWYALIDERRYLTFIIKALFYFVSLKNYKSIRRLFEYIDFKFIKCVPVSALIDKYSPDIILTTNLFGKDNNFIREAKRCNIRNICILKSWDNLTSKTRINVPPDLLLVWNRIQCAEALRLHHLPRCNIRIVGALNFNFYEIPNIPLAYLHKRLGISPDKFVIVYSPANKLTYSDDINIKKIEMIIASGAISNAHLHIRQYPKTKRILKLSHNTTVEDSGRVTEYWSDRVDQLASDIEILKSTMAGAGILVQVGSTIAIDALINSVPVIHLAWNQDNQDLARFSVKRNVDKFTHNKYLIDAGLVNVINNESEFIEFVNKHYIKKEIKKNVVRKFTGPIDGNVHIRIFNTIG